MIFNIDKQSYKLILSTKYSIIWKSSVVIANDLYVTTNYKILLKVIAGKININNLMLTSKTLLLLSFFF